MGTSGPILFARIMDENDFLKLKEMVHRHDEWSLSYDKANIKIWSRISSNTNIRMIKVWSVFSSITSVDLYNTLMDPDYRKVWDTHLLLFYDIGYLNFNNEITYYAASFPPPLRSRDFVLQTSWLDRSTEHFILNHSVCHKDHPPRPGFIRAISHFTGYFINNVSEEGCEMFFVSQTDLQGIIPNWVVAKCTQVFAPRIVKQIEKAAAGYSAWKSQNNPHYFPWTNPEQIKGSIIPLSDCVPSEAERKSPFFRYVIENNTYRDEGRKNSSPEHQNESRKSSSGTTGVSMNTNTDRNLKTMSAHRIQRSSGSRPSKNESR